MISRAKKYVAVLLVFVCVCMIFSPQTAYAAEDSSQHETVKVGFFAMDGYHVMDEEGNRSGYGYDFLRLMARYWDVDYEYVGYDKSWDDMQQMLEDGEIDMVTSARKTPDREEKFDFSRPIGTNYGMLTVRSDNSTIVDGNYSTYNGMRVALLNGNTRNEEFADFADNKGFTYVPSYFDTTAEMEEALQSEKVDAIVTSSLRKTNNERIVDKFGSSDFYVIVKKGNTELLNEINYAIDQMNAVEGDWKTTLYNKNYESIETKNLEYTKKEKSIISQYSKDNPLHVLCDPTRYPYSYNENGEMKGIIPDYFRKIADYAGISYKFLTPATRDEYIAYQKNTETTGMSIDARLRDVLVNILSNAVKFTPDGGTITFEARCQEKGGDGYINMRYRISDTGIGMSEEFTKEVFEEFAQEDSDVRTQYHGVGLGMAIVKKYVDMMGGTISVQSKKHEGTTFTVDIPLEITDKECNKSDTGFSEKVNLAGVKVLLAEDNELNAEIATVQLEEFGMNVERAVDGKNAVEIFRNHPEGTFDVILMDIMMPEMNGYEAAKAIRAMNDRPDGKNIPIIAMTANSFAEDVQASLDAGMNAHLSKPIVIDEVIKTILRYVSQ